MGSGQERCFQFFSIHQSGCVCEWEEQQFGASAHSPTSCCYSDSTYPFPSFAPTKLNVADDPTRDVEIRRPCKFSLWDSVPLEVPRKLHSSGLSRPLANWIIPLITLLQEGSATSFNESLASSCHPADDVLTWIWIRGRLFDGWIWIFLPSCCLWL